MPKKSEIYGTFIKGKSIGSGGMAEVFEGIDKTDSSNKCAIKLIKYECSCMDNSCKKCIGFRERFHREQIALKKLDHPNIVKVLGVSEENEKKPYILMEYLNGKTLDKIKDLPLRQILIIAISIAKALQCVHSNDIIHRDIKPGNIFLLDDNKTIKLMDFGIAYMKDLTRLTRINFGIGTKEYMSPEQMDSKEIDRRSDLYSFGLVLYELITGKYYNNREKSAIQLTDDLNSKVGNSGLENIIINKLLNENPDERYSSAIELSYDLISFYITIIDGIDDELKTKEKNLVLLKEEYAIINRDTKQKRDRLNLLNRIFFGKSIFVVFISSICLVAISIVVVDFLSRKSNNDLVYREYVDFLSKSVIKKELIVAVAQDEWSKVEGIIKNFLIEKEVDKVKRIYITDIDGIIKSSTDNELIGKNSKEDSLSEDSKFVIFEYPIIHSIGKKIGSLHITIDNKTRGFFKLELSIIVLITIVLIASGSYMYYYRYRLIHKNFEIIRAALTEISNKNFIYRMEKPLDNDDLFMIYEGFNQMANNIEIEIKKLQDKN